MDQGRLHKELLILLPLLLFLATGLRVLRLNWQPLWWDEGYSLYASTMSVGSMITETAEDIHPPLYYILLHVWQWVLGPGPVAARLFSVFVGIATVLVVFRVAKSVGGEGLGWLAGLIVAVNPFHVYYSQEIRMYALAALLGLLSAYFMWLWLDQESGRRKPAGWWPFVIYLATTVAALYTHYYTVFIPLAQTAFVLLYYRRRPLVLKWLAGQVALVILYAPWLVFTVYRLTSYISGKVAIEQYRPLGPVSFLAQHVMAFALGHLPVGFTWLYWASPLFLALAALGVWGAHRVAGNNRRVISWVLLVGIPLIGAYLINLVYPFSPRGYERLMLFAALSYYLLVGLGCLYLWNWRKAVAGLIMVSLLATNGLALWAFYTTPRYTDDDYRPLVDRVRLWAAADDAVLCLYPWQIGYFESAGGLAGPYLEPAFKQDWPSRQNDPSLLPNYIANLMAHHRRIWFPAHQTGGRILEREIESYLASHYSTLIAEWANPHTRLWLFGTVDSLVTAANRVNFGDIVHLISYGLSRGPVSTDGGTVNVDLQWQLASAPREPYYVSLRLVDDSDYTWAIRSGEPVAGLKPFSEWRTGEVVRDVQGLLVPADAPPGQYAVKVGVYRRSDDRGLDVIGPAGAAQGIEANLGTIQLVLPAKAPAANRLQMQYRALAEMTDDGGAKLRLLGYNLPAASCAPGTDLPFVLFWEPLTPIPQDNLVVSQVVDRDNKPVAHSQAPPFLGRYPMTQWKTGYPVRDVHHLVVPPEVSPGEYRIQIGISHPAGNGRFRVEHTGRDYVELGAIQVSGGRAHDFKPPQVAHPLKAVLGEEVGLLGYDVASEPVAADGTIQLALYWQALAPMQTSYTVFIHVLDKDERIWGQVDTVPGKGTLPTTGWVKGEYLRDTYTFQIKPDAPAGSYRIEIGLYDAVSGTRRPVRMEGSSAATDRVLLDTGLTVH